MLWITNVIRVTGQDVWDCVHKVHNCQHCKTNSREKALCRLLRKWTLAWSKQKPHTSFSLLQKMELHIFKKIENKERNHCLVLFLHPVILLSFNCIFVFFCAFYEHLNTEIILKVYFWVSSILVGAQRENYWKWHEWKPQGWSCTKFPDTKLTVNTL